LSGLFVMNRLGPIRRGDKKAIEVVPSSLI
jgi:hypothetical protein